MTDGRSVWSAVHAAPVDEVIGLRVGGRGWLALAGAKNGSILGRAGYRCKRGVILAPAVYAGWQGGDAGGSLTDVDNVVIDKRPNWLTANVRELKAG
jgi:hypothetical protein